MFQADQTLVVPNSKEIFMDDQIFNQFTLDIFAKKVSYISIANIVPMFPLQILPCYSRKKMRFLELDRLSVICFLYGKAMLF